MGAIGLILYLIGFVFVSFGVIKIVRAWVERGRK